MQQTVNSITNWVSEYDQLNKSLAFQHNTSVFNCDGVRIISVASTPTVMKVYDPDCTIAIPITGSIKTSIDGKMQLANVGDCIFFAPGKRHVEGGVKSVLLLSIPENQLLSVAASMLNKPLQLKTRVLSVQHGATNFLTLLLQLCALIDQFGGNLELLKNFSVKESLVRLVVIMIEPQYLSSLSIQTPSTPAKSIDLLCEYISANLDQPLPLSTLEKVAGVSARTIQLEFQKKFRCTPIQWIRQQRINKAFVLLKNPTPTVNVSQVAAYCGYTNFSDFARHYAQQCGELPSETLLKNK